MKKVDNRIYRFTSGLLIGMLGIISFSCVENENGELFELKGFIAGYNYCSFHSNGRVGYVIISNDLADTISTYSLSPAHLSLPTPVGLNPSRPIFTIPQHVFDQAGSTRTPEVFLDKFPIRVIYKKSTEEDKQRFFFACIGTLSTVSFATGIWDKNQVIIVKASRN